MDTEGTVIHSARLPTNGRLIAGNESSARKQAQFHLTATFCAAILIVFAQAAQANPVGANVVNGQATFSATANTLTVTNTPGTIINWQGFSINSNEVTKFAQQSAASTVLNRVVGSDPSNIMGTLQSNGRVFLINPNGILFGAGAVVDVAGLMASTLNLSDADFLAGNHHYTEVPGAGNISNAGNISAQQGGQIYLIAPNVENTGVITAPNGEILLAAGYSVDLVSTDNPDLRVNITAPAGDATNVGQLIASSGSLSLFGTVVSNSGIVSADSATMQGGKIVFKASQRVEAGGTISASGSSGGRVDISAAHSLDPNAPGVVIQTGRIEAQGTAGAGGSVSINADSILSTAAINTNGTTAGGKISVQATNRALSTSSAQYTASSTEGQGGDILVSADVSNYTSGSYSTTGVTGGNITMAGNEIKLAAAQLDASGTNGGGAIHVGGLMHGAAGFAAQGIALANSTNVLVNSATTLKADALQTGNGGEVVLWSDQAMRFTGRISAKGGAISGNGGNAEVSGLTSFGYGGLTDLSAANGLNGTLLLDPNNITIVSGGAGLPFQEILDPTPGAGEGFGGATNIGLNNGNIVITSPLDSLSGASSGAVYLYNPVGSLVSALVGSAAGDQVGVFGSITQLANGNIVVDSSNWGSGGVAANALGAVTWMNGATGLLSDGVSVGGTVSAANSLVGGAAGDAVGSGGITVLTDNVNFWNVAVNSSQWGSAGVVGSGLGAVTWMDGSNGWLSTGLAGGAVTSANSVVGSIAGDGAWVVVKPLTNGNAAVAMPLWDNATVVDAGAVTWMNGVSGLLADGISTGGAISAANSLVGSGTGDRIGSSGIATLSNGNYVVLSQAWGSNSTAAYGGPGAVTWVDGSNGNTLNGGSYGATVSSVNSLVGSSSTDYVGAYGVTSVNELPVNGNLVVNNNYWNVNSGAATWMNGKTGQLINGAFGGAISAANSLVGTAANEQAGSHVTALANGNYLLTDFNYNGGAGAVVFGLGASGVAGNVSAANSLVGSLTTDNVGLGASTSVGIDILPNGNYLVRSPNWNLYAGAVTFGNGSTGTVGLVSASNSLIGSTGGSVSTGDRVGYSPVTLLANGNYVVNSSSWNDPVGFAQVGAVTWGNGTSGTVGAISSSNSLVGSTAFDRVGYYGVIQLSNGNYVVNSPYWSNGATSSVGAVTFGIGTTGVSGVVSATNSLVGSTAGDNVGIGGVTTLINGNYVVSSYSWNGGFGAATWGSGLSGTVGVVSGTNSLVGSTAGDNVGIGGISPLINGNYVASSYSWNGGLGAVTWGNGSGGTVGIVSGTNSLVGSTVGDNVGNGGVTPLTNGNYVVSSYSWNGGFGAVTWGNGSVGTVGVVSSLNSLVGSTVFDNVGSNGGIGHIVELSNGNLVVSSYGWGSTTGVLGTGLGAVTWMDGANGTVGVVSAANSLVGSTAGDLVGSSCDCSSSGYVIALSDGNYAVISPSWTNGSLSGAGAASIGDGAKGSVGKVTSTNSLVGTAANEHLGSGAFELIGQPGKVLIGNAAANNGMGGVYLLGGTSSLASLVNGSLLFTDNPSVDASIGAALLASTLDKGTNVLLQANNDITQLTGAAINSTGAGNLTLQAGHNVTLNDLINIKGKLVITSNDPGALLPGGGVLDTSFATLTASQISLTNYNGDIVLGIINGGSGGVLALAKNGNMTLGNTVSSSATGNAVVLVAGLLYNSNDNSINLTAPVGTSRWLIYSATPVGGWFCCVSPDFTQYSATYGVTTVAQATGNGFLFNTAAALLTVGLTGTVSKVYDGTTAATLSPANYSLSGAMTSGINSAGTDILSISNPGTGSYSSQNAGTGITVTASGFTVSAVDTNGMPVYGYTLPVSASGAIGTITPATLTVAANSASKILNTADPLLTYTVSGLQFTDTTATTLTPVTLSRTVGETVGNYPISISAGLISTNYTLSLVGANFTILVPTVINEIVDISNQNRKKIEDILASETPTGEGGNTQSLPMCN